jgi:hypothetical protein
VAGSSDLESYRGEPCDLQFGPMQTVVTHLPHLIPAVAGLGFLGWFSWHLRTGPPPDLNDQELAAWQEARSARRKRPKLER